MIAWQPDWLDVMRADFMQHALLAGACVAVVAGIVGWFVVVRSDTFAAHALAHIGFPGATGAALLGVSALLGASVFCIVGALLIGMLGRDRVRREMTTGTVLAGATALGVLFNSLASGSTISVTNVLFGSLLAVSTGRLIASAVITVVVLVVLAVIGRPLAFASVDPEVAQARGVPVALLGTIFTMLLALTVAVSVQIVGTLLVFALVVTPAATAVMLTARPRTAMLVAVGVALGSVVGGLVASAMTNLPPSFCVVALAVSVWAAVRLRPASRRSASASG
jgi:zinc/manganese transport system permease protein